MQPMVIKGVVIPLLQASAQWRYPAQYELDHLFAQSLYHEGHSSRSVCSTIMAGDENVIGSCLRNTTSHDTDAYF
jgi:hypothetical protein